MRWNLWQICLGYFKNIQGQDFLAVAKKHRRVYEQKKKEMKEVFDSYQDPLLLNPLLKVKEQVLVESKARASKRRQRTSSTRIWKGPSPIGKCSRKRRRSKCARMYY